MSIIVLRRGFTLIELIIVILIMGMVAGLVSSRLTHIANHLSVLTPATLKNYLSALSSDKRLDLLCYDNCTRCDLWEGDKKIRTDLLLESNGSLIVRRFDRFGHLVAADPVVRSDSDGMREGNFVFSLYPDGVTSSLIIESEGKLITYTPLSDPTISPDEEHLRTALYNMTLMNRESYYGGR